MRRRHEPGGRTLGQRDVLRQEVLADTVSSRQTTFVERHTASSVMVVAAMMSVVPRKFGPPESP
jgi:hypothetical protein